MRNYLGELQGILDTYGEELEAAGKKRKAASGIFGFGPKPGDDPCHEKADRAVQTLLEQLAGENDPETAGQVVDGLFRAEAERKWPADAQIMMIALQRHALPLLEQLPPEKKRELQAWYEKRYKRSQRLPLQKTILKLLKE